METRATKTENALLQYFTIHQTYKALHMHQTVGTSLKVVSTNVTTSIGEVKKEYGAGLAEIIMVWASIRKAHWGARAEQWQRKLQPCLEEAVRGSSKLQAQSLSRPSPRSNM